MTDLPKLSVSKYRLQYIFIPEWYASELIGERHYRFSTIDDAMTATWEWWIDNLRDDWEENYLLEEVLESEI